MTGPHMRSPDEAHELTKQWSQEDLRNFAIFVSGYSPAAVDAFEKRRLGYRLGTPRLQPAEKAMSVDEAVRVLADAAGVPREFVQGFADLLTGPSSVADESRQEARAAINQLFRAASKGVHPDSGESTAALRLISKARDVLLTAGGTRA